MKKLPLLALASFLGPLVLVGAACGEDTAAVRPRLDGGVTDGALLDVSDGDSGALSCGALVPTTYESAAFAQNAGVELALAQRHVELGDKMRSAEGPGGAALTVYFSSMRRMCPSVLPTFSTVCTTGSLHAKVPALR